MDFSVAGVPLALIIIARVTIKSSPAKKSGKLGLVVGGIALAAAVAVGGVVWGLPMLNRTKGVEEIVKGSLLHYMNVGSVGTLD